MSGLLWMALGLALLAACSDGGNARFDVGPDASADGGTHAVVDSGAPGGPVFDTSRTWGAAPLACADAPRHREGRALGSQRRFALSVLHYNIQYVAGGLDNFQYLGMEPYDGWNDDRVQDTIVTESLEPILELLDRHPSWTLTIEMQGYLAEVLLARHRETAQHLADLVGSGQVELLSFHYADQLFLAHPRLDLALAVADRVNIHPVVRIDAHWPAAEP